MKLIIDINCGSFLGSLKRLHDLLEHREVMPILSHLKLVAQQGRIMMTANNMESSGEEVVACDNLQGEGTILLPGFLLHKIVGELSVADNLHMELEEEGGETWVRLSCGRAQFKLRTLDEGYPPMDQDKGSYSCEMAAADFLNGLRTVDYAVPREVARPSLKGVYCHTEDGGGETMLRMVATDGHRMSMIDVPLAQPADNSLKGVIIPVRAVKEMTHLLQGVDGQMICYVSDTGMRIEFGDVHFYTRLLEDRYPDYRGVVPSDEGAKVSLQGDLFLAMMKRMGSLVDHKNGRLSLRFARGLLGMSVHHDDHHEGSDEADVDYDGEELELRYNIGYLTDAVLPLEGGMVQLFLRGSGGATTVRGEKNPHYLGLLMPIKA